MLENVDGEERPVVFYCFLDPAFMINTNYERTIKQT